MNNENDVQIADLTADEEIRACLDLDFPKSFFLYAGAGSGKTRSLVNALEWVRSRTKQRMWLQGQHVAVITYTNAAVDEIKQRLDFDALIEVSTIHSFAWSLIKSFQSDIRHWLRNNLAEEISEIQAAQAKGRAGTKAALDREASIKNKSERLQNLDSIREFTYNPNGDNSGRDSLSHTEVIQIASDFLKDKPTFQNILVNRYPFLLIDESQDTNRELMEAILSVQQIHHQTFSLGLFGDTMQRIYSDGKDDLGEDLPDGWAHPAKQINYRCPKRVLQLINKIRTETDKQQQVAPDDKTEGFVRLFLLTSNTLNKSEIENKIADRMAGITGDELWKSNYKALILEHHMAAKRLGFEGMFEPLATVYRTALLDGSLSSLTLFSKDVLPLVEAMQAGDKFAVASIVKSRSPLLDPTVLKTHDEPLKQLQSAKKATKKLMALWDNNNEPTFLEVLLSVSHSGLFPIPEILRIITAREGTVPIDDEPLDQNEKKDPALEAWDKVMSTPFKQVKNYYSYVSDKSIFGTHQGVKGREFPRVMVIIDDEEARGFLFSYDKLFGAKEKSARDLENENRGDETTIDRTRRLFYVTCSRAENSLAIVAYTSNPPAVKAQLIEDGWFDESEIIESLYDVT